MSTITLRLVKGAPLTNQEVDDNFANLNNDKYEAGDSASLQDLTLSGMSGPIAWNVDDGALDIPLNADVTLQTGQEFVFYAKATEAISNGDVVMFAGAQGGHLLIAKANMSAAGFDPTWIVGVATQDFAINEFGYTTALGKVRGLDTSALSEGDILYVDPTTAGAYTTTKPSSPNHIIQMAAVVRSHGTQGTIQVRVTHIADTDEVPEGATNLYFTNARAVAAIKADADWNATNWDTAYSWGDHAGLYLPIDAVTLPDQTGHAGQFLTTNGTTADWATVDTSLGDTAYGWGDHALAGYLTSYTETDPVFSASAASGITSSNITNWNTAYGWGNHASQGYATQTYVNNAVSNLVDSAPTTLDTLNELAAALGDDPNFATTVSNSIGTKWTQDNTKISNWDTAYGWGDHSTQNYAVTTGDTFTGNLNIDGGYLQAYGLFYLRDDLNFINSGSDGWHTIIEKNGGNPYFNAIDSYRVNGTTVIDSSRSLININGLTSSEVLNVNRSGNGNAITTKTGSIINFQVENYTTQTTIRSDTGTLYFWQPNSSYQMKLVNNGAVSLAYDGTWRLDTTSTGILATGHISRFSGQQNGESRLELYNNRQDLSNVPVYSLVGYNGSESSKITFYRGSGGSGAGYIRFATRSGNSASMQEVFQIGENSDAWGVNVLTGGYRVGGTTVIDSSRNITNIGALALGQDISAMDTVNLDLDIVGNASIRSSSGLYFGVTTSNFNSWKTRVSCENSSTMYVNSQALVHNNFGYGSSTFFTSNSSGMNVQTGGFQINGTTVIDSSRNLTNIGSASLSGAITAQGYIDGTTSIINSSGSLGVKNSSDTTGRGLSLYGGAQSGMPTYGLAFAGTYTFGTHGGVSGSWATYFTMSDTTDRGWIFKRGTTNVASISGSGHAKFDGYTEANNGLQVFRNLGNQIGNWPTAEHTMSLENSDAGWLSINFHRAGYTSDSLYCTGSSFNFTDNLNLTSGGYQIGGTTVIDSDHNAILDKATVAGYVQIEPDDTYSGYYAIGFQGTNTANGVNKIFARGNGADGLYICSATSRNINFRTNGSNSDTFSMTSTGNFLVAGTTAIDSSRNTAFAICNANSFAGGAGKIFYPSGAEYQTSASSVSGAIKIRLPQLRSNTMMRMTVKVYEYAGGDNGSSFTIELGGYNYSDGGWYNVFANVIGDTSHSLGYNVRFGEEGGYNCIWISEPTDSWAYPQVFVTEFQGGYSKYESSRWDDNWDITFETTLGSVYKTITANQIGKVCKSSLTATNFIASGSDTSPAGTPFSNTFKGVGTSRTAYFDGDGSSVSTWYGVGNTPFSAIDSTNGNMEFWVNHTNGTWYRKGKYNVDGLFLYSSLYFDDYNTRITQGSGNSIKAQTNYGYIEIAPQNGSYCHFQTDISKYYFNKRIVVDEGVVSSYNEDLILRRAESSSHQMTLNTSGATFTGNVTAYSDITLKDNITEIDNALDKVNSIRGVTYDRIDQDNARHAGVIAQEVEEVLPEVVHTDDNGIKSVAYGNMVGLLIEAIKEQQAQINKLKEELKNVNSN